MLLKCCISCEHHMVRTEDRAKNSYCSKENCWSRYSKCINEKALDYFIKDQCITPQQPKEGAG